MALDVYKEILSRDLSNPQLVQKIGSHFISLGQIETSEESTFVLPMSIIQTIQKYAFVGWLPS